MTFQRPWSALCGALLFGLWAVASWGQARPQDPGPPELALKASALRELALLADEKQSRTPIQRKIDSRLLFSARKLRGEPIASAFPHLRTLAAEADGRVPVQIELVSAEGFKTVVAAVRKAGGTVAFASRPERSVSARIPIAAAESLGALPAVQSVKRDLGYELAGVGVAEGDVTHRAQEARDLFGVSGAGVKVCVLSNGVDSLAAFESAGILPHVDILPGQQGKGDEGTAMLQIVHALAPGASLGFATAVPSFDSFSKNILDLHNAGCDIEVDDVLYLVESPFQDLGIAQAVRVVTQAGGIYISSAGNDGNLDAATSGTWEGDFRPNGRISTLPARAGVAHDFGDGGQSDLVTADTQLVTLHWSEPFAGARSDYDLYIMDHDLKFVLDFSTTIQDGHQDPIEAAGIAFAGDRIVVVRHRGANRMIHLTASRGRLEHATAGCTRGHATVPNAIGVAAVDASRFYPGPFTAGPGVTVEPFSCDGPRRSFFTHRGRPEPGAPRGDLSSTGGVIRHKPDIAGADRVTTSVPGFSRFAGTSAAAPHVAAILALLKQPLPAMSSTDLRNLLLSSALDISGTGFDRNAGSGIAMPVAALTKAGVRRVATVALGGVKPVSTAVNATGSAPKPGETWGLQVEIRNLGGATAQTVHATVTSASAGVTMTQAEADYPDIDGGSSAINATPLVFRLAPDFPCGALAGFHIRVDFLNGVTGPAEFDAQIATGSPGDPVVVAYGGPPVTIPDSPGADVPGETATVPIDVAGIAGRLLDVDFRIDGTCDPADSATMGIEHGFVQDLRLELVSPSGTVVRLIDRVDLDGDHFCQTLLDDESGGPPIQGVTSKDAPFTGTFTPASPLGVLHGEDPNGRWLLKITDMFHGDTGTARAVSLRFRPASCAVSATAGKGRPSD
jgi:subtilase family protein/proprotein convertase P-domain-containing protein